MHNSSEVDEMTEQERKVENPFVVCGYLEVSPSGRSIRIVVTLENSLFEQTYYVGKEANTQVLNGHKKTATVYRMRDV